MNKDVVLARVEIIKDMDNIEKLVYIDIYKRIPKWLMNINDWINERIASSRIHIGRLYDESNIVDLMSFINVCNCTSLSDTLWIKGEQDKVSWKSVSLFRNKFNIRNSEISLNGFSKVGFSRDRSPEYTTLGAYDKCWKRDGKEIVLLKKSSEKYSEGSGNEAFSEYYSNIVCRDSIGLNSGKDYIDYSISRYGINHYISKCKCFTNERYGFIPISLIADDSYSIEYFNRLMANINSYSHKLYMEMVTLDYITMNTDRHVGNFGCIIDNDSLKVIRMAPIFDNNLALYPRLGILDKGIKDIREDLSELRPKYSKSFEDELSVVVRGGLRLKLRNIKFNRIPGISEERVKLMEMVTNERIDLVNKLMGL